MVWKWWQNESQVACEDSITGPLLDDNNPCWAGLGVNTITNPGLFKNASSFVMKVDTAGHTKITKQRKQLNITASTMKVCTLNWKVTPSSFRFFRWLGWLGINTLIPMVLITKHGDGCSSNIMGFNIQPHMTNLNIFGTNLSFWCDTFLRPHGMQRVNLPLPSFAMWVCLKIGYIPNYSHLIGIMIINHWV